MAKAAKKKKTTPAGKSAPRKGQTDLERHVRAPGRDKLVKDVRKKINELGVTYIYFQFVSVTGRIVGKGIPADHWEAVSERGFQLVYGSTANLYTDRYGEYIGYGPEASELVGIPDPETFVQLPWDKRVARVFCTCFRNREERENPGGALTSDCRGNLRRISQEFEKKHRMHMRAGTEPEMMWLKRGEDGLPDGGFSKPNCYHIDQFESLRPAFMKVIEYSQAMGLDMIQGDHEDAPGQLELNWMYDDVLRNADRLTTYRQVCAQVAREMGLIACFMSKPFMGVSASGCHHNVSLWSGGSDKIVNTPHEKSKPGLDGVYTYRQGGTNHFAPVPKIDPVKPGPVGLKSIGGVIEHLGALTALGASTVNSYRRLWDVGFWAPVFADWGYQNRTCALRVSAPGRFEYRSVDSMVNPYLMGAALYKAFDDGISRNLDPGEPEERNIYEAMEAGKQVKKLPMSLGEALDRLDKDNVIKSALPDEMYKVYRHYKRNEWESFMATVTDWDINTYWDCLP